MSDSSDLSRNAENHLRVIRQMMERATVYRVLSAVPAILAGAVAVVVAVATGTRSEGEFTARSFVITWLIVYVLVDLFNAWTLFREARKQGGAFPSRQLLHAVAVMIPPMGVFGLLGVIQGWSEGDPVTCALFWALGYGLALVAMFGFAPRSIQRLGWAFLLTGVGWYLGTVGGEAGQRNSGEALRQASWIMGVTFGGFHLIYGLVMLVVTRRLRD